MADIKFGAYSQAVYGEVQKADRPRSTGLTLVPINRYSGRPVPDTDVEYYGNNPKDIVERLYLNGQLANGLINNKLYENGQEVSKEQAQAAPVQNYAAIAGELASLGIRTPVGTGGKPFERDAAAEKKVVETIRANIKAGKPFAEGILGAGILGTNVQAKDLANASDAEIIAFVGGVNKEGVIGANYGINALYDPYSAGLSTEASKNLGYGTGIYGGSGPGQYVRGSRAITESDILALGKIVGNAANDPQAAANASRQLISIFENDSSWVRREQARDALSYGLPGYPGGPEVTSTAAQNAAGATGATDVAGTQKVATIPTKTYTSKDGLEFTDQMAFATYQTGLMAEARAKTEAERLAAEAEAKAAQAEFEKKFKAENAAISLTALFEKYGLGTLAPKVKELAIAGYSDDTITIQLAETPEYKQRFRANEDRRKKGLSVLSPSQYIGLEDDYRQILRAYGLKSFDNDDYVTQFISNDMSTTELTNRVATAVNRVQNADPAVLATLRSYYNIADNDLVSYVLDPEKQFPKIERQVQAAEIGAAAGIQGLTAGISVAEQLAAQGVTKAQAQKGYATIAEVLPTTEKLSDIYKGTLDEYRQLEAEQEVFNTLASAQRKRRALVEREIATFGGASGLSKTSLDQVSRGSF